MENLEEQRFRLSTDPKIMNFRELIIRSMKYLAEHSNLEYQEMVEGLKMMGWIYSINDVNNSFIPRPSGNSPDYNLRQGSYYQAANTIANAISHPINYNYVQEYLLNEENSAIVEFIRKASGDEAYKINLNQNKTK